MSIADTEDFVTRLKQDNLKMYSAILRVREIHKSVPGPYDNLVCDACSHMNIHVDFYTSYPCPTIQALDGNR